MRETIYAVLVVAAVAAVGSLLDNDIAYALPNVAYSADVRLPDGIQCDRGGAGPLCVFVTRRDCNTCQANAEAVDGGWRIEHSQHCTSLKCPEKIEPVVDRRLFIPAKRR